MDSGGAPPNKDNYVPDLTLLTQGEEQLARQVEEDAVLAWREEEVKEAGQKRLWTQFQQTAAALTQVYQGQMQEGRDWQPFQTAAGSLTLLYKESLEEQGKAGEINRKLGYQRAREDIVNWAKSKRRFIRREELFAFLASNSPGPGLEHGSEPQQEQTGGLGGLDRLSLQSGGAQVRRGAPTQQQLPTLQEMLDLSRLEAGAVGARKRSPSSPNQSDEEMESPQTKKLRKT